MFANAIFMNTPFLYGLNFKYYIFYMLKIIIIFDKKYHNYVNITISSFERSIDQENDSI
jgi:hypothetical protein